MILLVTGGRSFDDRDALWRRLDAIHAETPIKILIQGGQREWTECFGRNGHYRGADWHAEEWAKSREVPCLRVPAEWKKHGKGAGPIRNSCQLEIIGRPDAVLFAPGGRGTADMLAKCREALVAPIPLTPTPGIMREEVDATD